MRELDFAYVGLGVHEEVVYSVAAELGYYADAGVRVSIRDGVRWDDDRLRQAAVVGLGRTLLIRLLAGTPWTMLCVNTERPLFWLMARAEFSDVSELRGRRVAMHPALVAPGCFARIILRGRGLDPDADIDAVPMHPGDYSEHVRLLKSGELDAAVDREHAVARAARGRGGAAPAAVLRRRAADPDHRRGGRSERAGARRPAGEGPRPGEPARPRAPCSTIPRSAQSTSAGSSRRADGASARDFYDRYVAPHFKAEGQPDPAVVARALPLVADELRIITGHAVDVPPAEEIYRSELTAAWAP